MVGGMAEIARVVRRLKLQFLSRRTERQLAVKGTSMTIHPPALSVSTIDVYSSRLKSERVTAN